jgi:hypothetical protein
MRAIGVVMTLTLLAGCSRVEPPVTNAARFVARMSCSCVFVTGRELQACLADLPPEARWLSVDVDAVAHRVRASALWLQGEARFQEGRGCQLQD